MEEAFDGLAYPVAAGLVFVYERRITVSSEKDRLTNLSCSRRGRSSDVLATLLPLFALGDSGDLGAATVAVALGLDLRVFMVWAMVTVGKANVWCR